MQFAFEIVQKTGDIASFLHYLKHNFSKNIKYAEVGDYIITEFQNLTHESQIDAFSISKAVEKYDAKKLKIFITQKEDDLKLENGWEYIPKSLKKQYHKHWKDCFLKENGQLTFITSDFIIVDDFIMVSKVENEIGPWFLEQARHNNVLLSLPKFTQWPKHFSRFVETCKHDNNMYSLEKITYKDNEGTATFTKKLAGEAELENDCNSITITDGRGKYTLYSNTPFLGKVSSKYIASPMDFKIQWDLILNDITQGQGL